MPVLRTKRENIGNDADKFFRANVQSQPYRKARHYFRRHTLRVLRLRNQKVGKYAYYQSRATVRSVSDREASAAVVR